MFFGFFLPELVVAVHSAFKMIKQPTA